MTNINFLSVKEASSHIFFDFYNELMKLMNKNTTNSKFKINFTGDVGNNIKADSSIYLRKSSIQIKEKKSLLSPYILVGEISFFMTTDGLMKTDKNVVEITIKQRNDWLKKPNKEFLNEVKIISQIIINKYTTMDIRIETEHFNSNGIINYND